MKTRSEWLSAGETLPRRVPSDPASIDALIKRKAELERKCDELQIRIDAVLAMPAGNGDDGVEPSDEGDW